MSSVQIRPRPLTSPSLRILLATPATTGRHRRGRRAGVTASRDLVAMLVSGLVAGAFITACELVAYRFWFRSAWQSAFANVAIAPRGVTTFLLVNAGIAAFVMLLYRWAEGHMESRASAALTTAIITVVAFWIAPTVAIAAVGLLPSPLLIAAPMLGVIAGGGATILGASIYHRIARAAH